MGKDIGKATKAEIQAWKEEHGEVFQYVSKDDNGDKHYSYARCPNIDDIDYSHSVGQGKPIQMSKALYESVYLGGSAFAKANDRIKRGVMAKLQRLVKSIEAVETKL